MKEDRKLTFLESIAISAATGAASGAVCGFGKVPEKKRETFTDIMVNLALRTGQKVKQKGKEGYINPPW